MGVLLAVTQTALSPAFSELAAAPARCLGGFGVEAPDLPSSSSSSFSSGTACKKAYRTRIASVASYHKFSPISSAFHVLTVIPLHDFTSLSPPLRLWLSSVLSGKAVLLAVPIACVNPRGRTRGLLLDDCGLTCSPLRTLSMFWASSMSCSCSCSSNFMLDAR